MVIMFSTGVVMFLLSYIRVSPLYLQKKGVITGKKTEKFVSKLS